jgi:hypothetical protein
MQTKKFDKEYLTEELGLPYEADNIVQLDEAVGKGRWSIEHRIVFEDGGEYWEAFYQVGATESQEERPWEYETVVVGTKVEKRPVTVEQWVHI